MSMVSVILIPFLWTVYDSYEHLSSFLFILDFVSSSYGNLICNQIYQSLILTSGFCSIIGYFIPQAFVGTIFGRGVVFSYLTLIYCGLKYDLGL